MRMPASIFHMPNTSLTKNCSNRISHEERSYRRNPPLKDVFFYHTIIIQVEWIIQRRGLTSRISFSCLSSILIFFFILSCFLLLHPPQLSFTLPTSVCPQNVTSSLPCLVATETTMSFLYNNMVWYNKRKRKERFLNSQKLVSQYLCSNVHTFAPQERSSDPIYSHFAFK